MQVTRLGHAAVLVETSSARLLVDPGAYSTDWHNLADLDAVLVTHQHPDHVDAVNIAGLMGRNPDARLLAEDGAITLLAERGLEAAVAIPGDSHDIGDMVVEVVGGAHAIIHPSLPRVGNVGYVVSAGGGPRLFHPGDAYDTVPAAIDVLALPLTAPWAKAAATADFLNEVAPSRAFPIHDGGLNETGWGLYLRVVGGLAGADISLDHIDPQGTVSI